MNRIGNDMLTKQIWERIAELGSARGFSADMLADAAHISNARVRAFANGVGTMRIDDITAFSHALDVPISEILKGIEP